MAFDGRCEVPWQRGDLEPIAEGAEIPTGRVECVGFAEERLERPGDHQSVLAVTCAGFAYSSNSRAAQTLQYGTASGGLSSVRYIRHRSPSSRHMRRHSMQTNV